MDIRLQIWQLNLQEHVERLSRLLPDPYEHRLAVHLLIRLSGELGGTQSVTSIMDLDDADLQEFMRRNAQFVRNQAKQRAAGSLWHQTSAQVKQHMAGASGVVGWMLSPGGTTAMRTCSGRKLHTD